KHGSITPQGQKQLALLEAKINDLQGKTAGKSDSEKQASTDKESENVSEKTENSDEKVIQAEKVEDKDKESENVSEKTENSDENVIQTEKVEDTDKATTDKNDKQEKANQKVVSPEETAADIKKQEFLDKYPVADKLVDGIDQKASKSQILRQLLENFKNIGFNYSAKNKGFTMKDKSYEKLLQGNLEGDCQTLARAFKAVAEGYFDVKGVKVDDRESSIKQPFLTEGDKIIDSSVEPNCDEGKKWFFQNHYWAVWNGQIFDVLFDREKEPEADKVRQKQSLKSSLIPEQQYYETESGKIIYPNQGKYLTGEIQTFEKLTSFIEDIGKNSPHDLEKIIAQIKSLYAKGGDRNSDFETLMQDIEKKRVNQASLNRNKNSTL
ncbi:MAG: hypothetical protein AAF349_28780, partial [Cyanobacteria bacterium P01_A01_bin.68]